MEEPCTLQIRPKVDWRSRCGSTCLHQIDFRVSLRSSAARRLTGLRIDLSRSRRKTQKSSHKVINFLLSSSRSEEHTSELQSQSNLVCRLLLEKKKKKIKNINNTQKNKLD